MSRMRQVPTPVIGVLTILMLCGVGFIYLFTSSGGRLPAVGEAYQVSFRTTDVKNLAPTGDVRIAGVKVGEVLHQNPVDGRAEVTIELDEEVAPLHEGATFRIGLKSLVGQQFVEVVDGAGKPIKAGTTVTDDSVIPTVDIDEVYGMLDEKTRASLSATLTSLGPVSEGRSEEVAALIGGLGDLGREGHTAVKAIAAQGRELRTLVSGFADVVDAFDAGQGDIATLVEKAQVLTRVTAGQSEALEETVRALPRLLAHADPALDSVRGLNQDLAPIAADLNAAAPDLNKALEQLPTAAAELRALMEPADKALGAAPKTLDGLPRLSGDLQDAVPVADELLRDVNPMLAYIRPYGLDIGSFFGNFGASLDRRVENGVQPVHLSAIVNLHSLRGNPLPIKEIAPLVWMNPYPAPGQADSTKKWAGRYPRVEREAK